jgi:hypothetical protein
MAYFCPHLLNSILSGRVSDGPVEYNLILAMTNERKYKNYLEKVENLREKSIKRGSRA